LIRLEHFYDALKEDFSFAAERVDFAGEVLVGDGIGVTEGEVFQLAA
jgi:hypothetical protein